MILSLSRIASVSTLLLMVDAIVGQQQLYASHAGVTQTQTYVTDTECSVFRLILYYQINRSDHT